MTQTCGNTVKLDPRIFSYFVDDITVPEKAIYIGGGKIEILIGMTCPRLHQQISMYGQQNINRYDMSSMLHQQISMYGQQNINRYDMSSLTPTNIDVWSTKY